MASESPRSHRVVEALRRDPPRLDDLQRARLERGVLEASAARTASGPPARRRPGFLSGVAVGAVAVAAALLLAWRWAEATDTATASFESMRDGVPVRAGILRTGERVQTSEGQLLRLAFGPRHVDTREIQMEVRPNTRAHLDALEGPSRQVRLVRGHVRVEYDPSRRGAESLRIETPAARVEVIGTVFEVEVDSQRVTKVRVDEGLVRIVPRQGDVRVVGRGESVHVPFAPRVAASGSSSSAGRRASGSRRISTPPVGDALPVDDTLPVDEGSLRDGSEQSSGDAPLRSAADAIEEPRRSAGAAHPRKPEQILPEAERVAEEPSRSEQVTAGAVRRGGPEWGPPLHDDLRFEVALRLFDRGQLAAARHELYAIARSTPRRASRARAWILVAETFEREQLHRQAADAYRRASQLGRTRWGADALFALGRLRSESGNDLAAKAAYRRYLRDYPDGPLAEHARRALCVLGEVEICLGAPTR